MDNITRLTELLSRQTAIASELRLMKGDYDDDASANAYANIEQAEDAADEASDLIRAAIDLLDAD